MTQIIEHRGGQHTSPAIAAPRPWSLLRREALPSTGCRFRHVQIDTPWIATVGTHPLCRAAIETGDAAQPPEELLEWLDRLNENLPEIGSDDRSVGLTDITDMYAAVQTICGTSLSRFDEHVDVLGRSQFDAAVGLTSGSLVRRLGHYASHVLAPDLAAFLDQFHRTSSPLKLYTPVEKRQRAEAEQRQAAARAQTDREQSALAALAQSLFESDSAAARERARRVVAAIDQYRAAIARK